MAWLIFSTKSTFGKHEDIFDTLDVLGAHSGESEPSGFINHHRAPCRQSRRKKEQAPKAHASAHNLCFLLVCTHQDASVLSFDVSSVRWQLIWSKKFPKSSWGNNGFVSLLHIGWTDFGKATKYERKTIFTSIQSTLRFRDTLNVLLWLSERASIREIVYCFIIHHKD